MADLTTLDTDVLSTHPPSAQCLESSVQCMCENSLMSKYNRKIAFMYLYDAA